MDYERLGRQIALPELGPDGQLALASRPVRFTGDPRAVRWAERAHSHAGGRCEPRSSPASDALVIALPEALPDERARLGLGAWGAIAAARALLGLDERALPADLIEALGARGHGEGGSP